MLGKHVAKVASNSSVGQVATLLLGMFICLTTSTYIFLVGLTMLPVLLKLFVSREKVNQTTKIQF